MTVSEPRLTERDLRGLVFTAEMYGLQLDLLAHLLGLTPERTRPVIARWRKLGYAESARIGPGQEDPLVRFHAHHVGGGQIRATPGS